MKEIITVNGPVKPEELGFCQCHEHLLMSRGRSFEINPALCIDDTDKSLTEVKNYRAAGGSSIIEAQPLGCNRMAAELKMISGESGVHIIASTGFHKMCFYPESHWIHSISSEELQEMFVQELTCGMYLDGDTHLPHGQSQIRAGLIKTAFDTEELSGQYKKLFTAAAKAALKTERILMIHVEQNTNPLHLLDYLTCLGMNPKDLMFCHMDRAVNDLRIHRAVLESGAYLEFDTIGRFKYHSDEHEISLFKALLEAGFERQLLFSLDTTRARLKTYEPNGIGLTYILNTFIKAMSDAGIARSAIASISTHNPARLLTQ